jgi:hypothetical protein
LETQRAVFGAEIRPAAATPGAVTARDTRTRNDAIAESEVAYFISKRDHTSDELVSEDDAGTAENWTMVPLRGIRTADRRSEYFEDDVIRARRRRISNILDPDISRPMEDSCFHCLNTRSGP